MLADRIECRIAVFVLVLLSCWIEPVRAQSDGEINAAFTANIGSGVNGSVNVPILQPDGKILIGGGFTSVAGHASNNIARLNPDGTFDASFVTGSGFNGPVSDLVLQPDGSVIAVGQFSAYNGATVGSNIARLDSAGQLDTRFNANVGTGFNGSAESVTLQLNGSIIIGGQFTGFDGIPAQYVARLDASGVFDTSFNSRIGTSLNNTLTTVLADPEGNIVLGGSFTQFNGGNYVARLNADGSPDASFSSAITAGSGQVTALALQPDGKILVGGVFSVSVNSVTSTDIARLNADGAPRKTSKL
ncbi:MAG: delta-60 repeat domain-containing protein [Methylococcaceae bacterium]